MIDLHHHLLPGLDDGAPDLATSVAMARMAAADGITHIVCTPHASGRYSFDPAVVAERLETLREALATEAINLTLGSGCDFHLSYDNIQDAELHPAKYAVNGKKFLLVELPDFGLSPGLDETFYDLRRAGLTPILTHPERNPTLQQKPERLAEWMRNGLLTQITTSSVLGQMGKAAEKMAHKLLADKWVHFLATDAHNLSSRPPLMRAACELVAKRYGAETARRLCVENPMAVFEGRNLGPQPRPARILTEFDEDDADVKPAWWKRFLGGR